MTFSSTKISLFSSFPVGRLSLVLAFVTSFFVCFVAGNT
jgi:hypothetical protein